MPEADDELRDQLLARIKSRRASIHAYVRTTTPRTARLAKTSLISSAAVSVLTAGPAMGGDAFTTGVAGLLHLPTDTIVWRVLCLGAVILSIVAAVCTYVSKANDVGTRLLRAETCHAELEALEALVQFGELRVAEAVKLYQQYVSGIPFIQEDEPAPAPQPAHA